MELKQTYLIYPDSCFQMDESHKELITTNLVAIMKDLDPSDIYSVLVAGGVLTLDDKDRISTTCPCRRDEAMELISVLLRKGPTAFGVLVDALQFTYPHLYDLLSVGVCTGEDKRVFECKLVYIRLVFLWT